MRKQITWMIALSSLLGLAVAYGQDPRAQQNSKNVGAVSYAALQTGSSGQRDVGWTRAVSQEGYFTVELPPEWVIRNEDSASASFSPAGRRFPAVHVLGWIPVPSRNPMLPCQRSGAQDFVAQVVPILRQSVPDLRIEQMLPSQPSPQARVVAISAHGGQPIRSISRVSVEYLLNPAFTLVRGCQAWDAFAFVGTIEAPPDELASLGPIGARILSTFAPAPPWGADLRAQYFRNVDRQLQMVGQTLGNISRMQMEQQMSAFETTRRVGQRWSDTLGDLARWTSPGDSSSHSEGTIPRSTMPSGTRWWKCSWSYAPIPSNTWPGTGCNEIPAPR